MRLAFAGKSSAVVSEAFNSNSINLLVGIGLPVLLVGAGIGSAAAGVVWLLGGTALTLFPALRGGGLNLAEGAILLAGYFGFVPFQLAG
ncbi:MAG TPA: hypothetical protein VNL71_02425 [Chloroflexota bacterium]|nr:hypothetical protein [Chloroflexota bacterium]